MYQKTRHMEEKPYFLKFSQQILGVQLGAWFENPDVMQI
tara:strand:+ start:6845 stop:6961 length:117 start_codon:yes stop_codon:yes gene_type:complete